jgi:hypothetical protein
MPMLETRIRHALDLARDIASGHREEFDKAGRALDRIVGVDTG